MTLHRPSLTQTLKLGLTLLLLFLLLILGKLQAFLSDKGLTVEFLQPLHDVPKCEIKLIKNTKFFSGGNYKCVWTQNKLLESALGKNLNMLDSTLNCLSFGNLV